jgi:tRNA-specific 2-thiouridylase
VGADEELFSRDLYANRLNWISIPDLIEGEEIRVSIKIRHRHTPAPATLRRAGDDLVHAIFDEPQRAITPGQSSVFYQEDEVVGGGWITQPPKI